ncbi:MAG: translation initiation factor IF-2 [Desulfatirhabdiaceae bacterium]|nr:translation initiation factor IF-2 [Desulfatirhabdiaceae bacterium]
MAKIRVFELARDLNMTNKVLLERMRDLDISVISHLSSLEDEDVAKIKGTVVGGKNKKAEAKQARPTIIRRRRETVPDETPPLAQIPPEEPEVFPEIAEKPAVKKDKQPVSTEMLLKDEKPESPDSGEADDIIAEKAMDGSEPEMPVSAKPVRTEEPALIISPAVKAPKKTEAPSDIVEIPGEEEKAALSVQEKPSVESTDHPEMPLAESSVLSLETRMERAGKKKKKLKKDMPAKIIRLAPPVPELPVPDMAKTTEPARHPEKDLSVARRLKFKSDKFPQVVPEVLPIIEKPKEVIVKDKDKKKKKVGKEAEEEVVDKKLVKKKIPFRKKEVVEGADLYSDTLRTRKAGRKGGKGGRQLPTLQKPQLTTPKAIKRRIKVDDTIALSELAKRMGIKASEIIVKLMGMGVMATLNQVIDFDTAVLVATEFNFELERAAFEEDTFLKIEKDDPEKRIGRPPVVTIMGHVDHGKTSLLDVIRKTRVTEGEAGGITQHIGAYHVATDRGQIVFLDTPGHEAFTAMRSRGAGITDLVVLVVAADDGVMPQTLEAINHSRVANVPIIVAINKIDKPGSDTDRVQRELADAGLVSEDWGGDTIFVKVSAKTNIGIDTLLEMILLQAEVMELKADPDRPAFGHVVEAKLDIGRGPVATVLVQQGTLRAGDAVVCGVHYGKVRALLNDCGVQVESAGPSIPVEVIGLSGVPMAGDELVALADEKDARQVSLHRVQKQRSKDLNKTTRLSLDKLFEQMKDGLVKDLNIIIKADVHGSIEALGDSLVKLSNEEVNINVIHSATGAITESDVSLATVSDAIIIGFNVRPSAKVQAMAAEEHVDMRFYNIIYNVIKDVKDAIVGMMKSTFQERTLGRAEVRDLFHVPKVGTIAGCSVTDGKIQRGKLIRLLRDGIVTFEGKISSLRRYKDDVKEVVGGYECGIGIENYNDIKLGDIIECYYMEEFKPEVE